MIGGLPVFLRDDDAIKMFKVLQLQMLKLFGDKLFVSSGGQPDGKGVDRFPGDH